MNVKPRYLIFFAVLTVASLGVSAGAPARATAQVVNQPPTASFTVSPPAPLAKETFTLDASASSDPEEGSLGDANHDWDLDNDGAFDDAEGKIVTHSFPIPGSYTVSLRVTDTLGATATRTEVVRVNVVPTASFTYEPAAPGVNEQVKFTSTSSDPEGQIPSSNQRWDFDNDGQFDDATGETVTRTFATAGTKTVRLEVTDSDGETAVASRDVQIQEKAPADGPTNQVEDEERELKLLSPFPIVRISGELLANGITNLTRLTVRAPKGTEATVRCKGERCPFDERVQTVPAGRAHFRGIEGPYRPGTVIKVFVTKPDRIGKYTRLKVRDGRAPKRKDKCVLGDSTKPTKCPGE
jgi:PKD repeat protein